MKFEPEKCHCHMQQTQANDTMRNIEWKIKENSIKIGRLLIKIKMN